MGLVKMTNLLKETEEAIIESGHTWEDVVFIGSESGYECTVDEFRELANFEYDQGFGASHIATDLVVVFKDGQTMTRGEYDGSEWWQFSKPFKHPLETKKISCLGNDSFLWVKLKEMNE